MALGVVVESYSHYLNTPFMMLPAAYVYILTNKHQTVLYVGMTADLRTRLWEHQNKINPKSFSARYNVIVPVYYQGFDSVEAARERELYIKGKTRKWKEDLIYSINPDWNDLSDEIFTMKP
jgi:putative endonuclease